MCSCRFVGIHGRSGVCSTTGGAAAGRVLVCRVRRLAFDDVPPVQAEIRRRKLASSWLTCLNWCCRRKWRRKWSQKDVKLIYDPQDQGTGGDGHAIHDRQRSDHAEVRQGLGHGGLGRGRETASGSEPHHVPAGRRRLGCQRGSEGRQERTRPVHCQHRRPGLVGQAGRQALRQSVLEAGERRRAEAVAATGQRDGGGRTARSRFSRRRKSRSVGRLRRGRTAGVVPLLEEVRRLRQTAHLQVRLPGRALHLPVDRQIRLSRPIGMGRDPAHLRRADEAAAGVAG